MTLRRAVAAIGVVVVTTVLAEGTSLVTAPAGISLVSQRRSPAGSGTSRLIATLKREDLEAQRAAMHQQAAAPSDASAQAAGRGTARQNPVGQASLTPPASASPFPKLDGKTSRATKAVFYREAVIR
jgi:hypothetical protein